MGLDAGQIMLDEDFDEIQAASSEKPLGRLVQTVAQSGLASAAYSAMTFTTEALDTHGFHDTAVNNSRVTPTVAGWYRVHGAICTVGQTDYTTIEVVLRKNGSSNLSPATRLNLRNDSQTTVIPVTALIDCNGTTDYFELVLRPTRSGAGTTSTSVASQFATTLEWQYERSLA